MNGLRNIKNSSSIIGFALALAIAGLPLIVFSNGAVASDDKEIIALEKKAWAHWKKADKTAYVDIMAEPAIKVSGAGIVSGKQSFLASELPKGCDKRDFALDSFTVHKISENVQIATYAAQITQTCNDEPDDHTLYVSSVWAKKGDTWKNVMLTESEVSN